MPSDQTPAQDTWDLLTCDDVDEFGHRYWYNETGDLHRENGPAVIYVDGIQCWYKHGVRHRIDGPAYIWSDGVVEYYLNDLRLTEEEFNARKLTLNGQTDIIFSL